MANRINVTAMIRNSNLDDLDDLLDVEVTKMERKSRMDKLVLDSKTFESPVVQMKKTFKESRKNWELSRAENRNNKLAVIA